MKFFSKFDHEAIDLSRRPLHSFAIHKKWSFPLRISSVNVTAGNCGFGDIYWRILMENFIFWAVLGIDPLMHNIRKWADTLWNYCNKCCKIFQVCMAILKHYAWRVKFLIFLQNIRFCHKYNKKYEFCCWHRSTWAHVVYQV